MLERGVPVSSVFHLRVNLALKSMPHYGLRLKKLVEAGKEFNITPYGTETMHVLRAEKGFIIAGQDTDGNVHLVEHGWAVGMKKPFPFIGKRGMQRQDCAREDRKQLCLKTLIPR